MSLTNPYQEHPDDGCAAAPSCLTCPFSQCREEDLSYFRKLEGLAHYYRAVIQPGYDQHSPEVHVRSYFRAKAAWKRASPEMKADMFLLNEMHPNGIPSQRALSRARREKREKERAERKEQEAAAA